MPQIKIPSFFCFWVSPNVKRMRSESPNIYDAESKYANFAGVVFVRHSKGTVQVIWQFVFTFFAITWKNVSSLCDIILLVWTCCLLSQQWEWPLRKHCNIIRSDVKEESQVNCCNKYFLNFIPFIWFQDGFIEQFKDVRAEREKLWWNGLLCTTLGLGTIAAAMLLAKS